MCRTLTEAACFNSCQRCDVLLASRRVNVSFCWETACASSLSLQEPFLERGDSLWRIDKLSPEQADFGLKGSDLAAKRGLLHPLSVLICSCHLRLTSRSSPPFCLLRKLHEYAVEVAQRRKYLFPEGSKKVAFSGPKRGKLTNGVLRGEMPPSGTAKLQRTKKEGKNEGLDSDQDLCTGDGLCEEIAPDVFTLLDDGLAYVVEDGNVMSDPGGAEALANFPDSQLDAVIESAEECPGECIYIEA